MLRRPSEPAPIFNDFIIALSRDEAFKQTTENLSQENRLGAFDQELVLRFFAMKNYRGYFKHDVGDFLTEYMEKVSDPAHILPFDYAAEKALFERTFSVLDQALGDKAFAYANRARNALTRAFSVYHFEAITLGLQSRIQNVDPADLNAIDILKPILTDIKMHPEFIRLTTGGGKNSPGQLNERISFVQERIEAAL